MKYDKERNCEESVRYVARRESPTEAESMSEIKEVASCLFSLQSFPFLKPEKNLCEKSIKVKVCIALQSMLDTVAGHQHRLCSWIRYDKEE